jgi:hypothetical protein
VLDYGAFLILDTATGLIRHLSRVLKVFFMTKPMGKSDPYPPAIAMHLSILQFHRRHNTCVWQMMVNHFNCFNEVQGEISFSVLARAMAGAPTGRDIAITRRLYIMSNVIRRYLLHFQDDVGHVDRIRYYFTVTSDRPEVELVGERMVTMVEDLATNAFSWYEGTKASYKTLAAAQTHQELRLEIKPLWISDISRVYKKLYRKAKIKTHSRWLEQFPLLWPEVSIPDALRPDIALDDLEVGRDPRTGRSLRHKRRRVRRS